MRKLLVSSSWSIVKTFLVLLMFSLLTTNYQLPTVYGQESSPSSNIKSKLEELKKEIASKAAEIKNQVNLKLQNKAYVGSVKTATESGNLAGSLTVAADTGPKIITVTQDTVFESKIKNKKVNLKSLAEEDYIAALGDIDDNGVLTAKKLILMTAPAENPKTYLWGQISSVTDSLITIKTTDKSTSVSTTSKTVFTGGSGAITENDLKVGDIAIVTGILNKNAVLQASFVYRVPQGDVIKPKNATDSAKEASVSAKPTATPKTTPKH